LYAYAFKPCLVQTTLVILSQWDVRVALASIPKCILLDIYFIVTIDSAYRYQITSLGLVPSLVHQIVNFPGIESVDFSSIGTVTSGAAHLPQDLKAQMQTLIPRKARFIEGEPFHYVNASY
jgi:acyl-CoA synthetase (AMP-forming)/AMP-acid ligase II